MSESLFNEIEANRLFWTCPKMLSWDALKMRTKLYLRSGSERCGTLFHPVTRKFTWGVLVWSPKVSACIFCILYLIQLEYYLYDMSQSARVNSVSSDWKFVQWNRNESTILNYLEKRHFFLFLIPRVKKTLQSNWFLNVPRFKKSAKRHNFDWGCDGYEVNISLTQF